MNKDWLLWGGYISPIDCEYYLLTALKSSIPESVLRVAKEVEETKNDKGEKKYANVGINICSDCLNIIRSLCIYLGKYGPMGSDRYGEEEKMDDFTCKAIQLFNKQKSKVERTYPQRKEKLNFDDVWSRMYASFSGQLNRKISIEDLQILANYPFLLPMLSPELFEEST